MSMPTLHVTRVISLFLLTLSYIASGQETQPQAANSQDIKKPTDDVVSLSRTLLRGLDRRGLSFEGLVVYDWSKTLAADKDSGRGFGRYSFDLSMPVDGLKLFGLKGSAGLVRLKHHLNHFGETYDGAAQLYSNIDAPSRTTLYELWFEQKLFSDKLRLKGGKIDANTEFATVPGAADFLNSSMGFSPTILAFPTYPEPKLGLSAFWQALNHYGIGIGVFQTASGPTLSIVEPGRTWKFGETEHPGRLSLGYWRLDGRVARFDGDESSGTQGFYSVMEQSVWRQPLTEKIDRELSIYFQAGWAEGGVSPFTHHFGSGAILSSPFKKRRQDAIGAAVTLVRFSADPDAGFDRLGELTIETYYKASFGKHLSLVQDFQYLHHPGGSREIGDCPVVTPRLVISF